MDAEQTNSMASGSASMIFVFLAGGLLGSLATYYILKRRWKDEKEAEINDVVKYYDEMMKQHDEVDPFDVKLVIEHPKEDVSPEDSPYKITVEEYVEDMDFNKETVVYYEKDSVLADMYDKMLMIHDTIGDDILNNPDYFDDDVVYCRNPKLGIDYEVVLEHKSYESMIGEDLLEE